MERRNRDEQTASEEFFDYDPASEEEE